MEYSNVWADPPSKAREPEPSPQTFAANQPSQPSWGSPHHVENEEVTWGVPASLSHSSSGLHQDGYEEATLSVAPAAISDEKDWGTFGDDISASFGAAPSPDHHSQSFASEKDPFQPSIPPDTSVPLTDSRFSSNDLPSWNTTWEPSSSSAFMSSEDHEEFKGTSQASTNWEAEDLTFPNHSTWEPTSSLSSVPISKTNDRWNSEHPEFETNAFHREPIWTASNLNVKNPEPAPWENQSKREYKMPEEIEPTWESKLSSQQLQQEVELGIKGGFADTIEREMYGNENAGEDTEKEWGAVSLEERTRREPRNVPAALIDRLQLELGKLPLNIFKNELVEDKFDKMSFVSELGGYIRSRDKLNELFHDLTRLPPFTPANRASVAATATRKFQVEAIQKTASNASEILVGTSRIPTNRFGSLTFHRPRVSASYFEDKPSPIRTSFDVTASRNASESGASTPRETTAENKGFFGGFFSGASKRASMSLSGTAFPKGILANVQRKISEEALPARSSSPIQRTTSPLHNRGTTSLGSLSTLMTSTPIARTSSPVLAYDSTPKARNNHSIPTPVIPSNRDLLVDLPSDSPSRSASRLPSNPPRRSDSPSSSNTPSAVSRFLGRFSQRQSFDAGDDDDDSDDDNYDYGKGLIRGSTKNDLLGFDDDYDIPQKIGPSESSDPFEFFDRPMPVARPSLPYSISQISDLSAADDEPADDGFDDFISSETPSQRPPGPDFEPIINSLPMATMPPMRGHKPTDSMSSFFRAPLVSGSGHNKTESMSSFFREPLAVDRPKLAIPPSIMQNPFESSPRMNGHTSKLDTRPAQSSKPPPAKPVQDLLDFDDFVSAPVASTPTSTPSSFNSAPAPISFMPKPFKPPSTTQSSQLSKADISFFENL